MNTISPVPRVTRRTDAGTAAERDSPADAGHALPVGRPHRLGGDSSQEGRSACLIAASAPANPLEPTPLGQVPLAPNPLGPWWRRGLHGGLAAMFVSLGVAGAVLPGLPATPFLLLASFFLSRSSPRLNERLHRCFFVGQILQDWEQQRGVRSRAKAQAVGMIVLCVGTTIAFSSLSGAMLGLIAAAAGVGILVVLRLPSAKL